MDDKVTSVTDNDEFDTLPALLTERWAPPPDTPPDAKRCRKGSNTSSSDNSNDSISNNNNNNKQQQQRGNENPDQTSQHKQPCSQNTRMVHYTHPPSFC